MQEVTTLHDDQVVSFTGKHTTYDRFNRIGIAWEGGRKEFGGAIHAEPFPFTFRLATVIDNQGGSAAKAREARDNPIEVGALVRFDGLPGIYRVVTTWSNSGVTFEDIADPDGCGGCDNDEHCGCCPCCS